MAESTGISWTQRTWNPWRGCTKISPGCRSCYMFTAQERYGLNPRKVMRTTTWKDPAKWQRAAEKAGRTDKVFTCSWSDFFHTAADGWRPEAWRIIRDCPNLEFQILTKRPDRILDHLPPDWGEGYPNAWLGVSVESPAYFWRIQQLRKIPSRIRFLSIEPMLERMSYLDLDGIHWVIVGGESGRNFRPMPHEWAREIMVQCRTAGVPFFFKQSAAYRTESGTSLDGMERKDYPTSMAVSP